MKREWRFSAMLMGLVILTGCAVGPDYKRPEVADLPTDWRWKKAQPRDEASKSNWWMVFNDPVLNDLEQKAVAGNTDLRVAMDRVKSSRAQARLRGAEFVPDISFDPSYSREQQPAHVPIFSSIPLFQPPERLKPYNSFSVPLDLSYELDIWGRVRRSFEAATAAYQASAAEYQNVLLTLTSDVSVYYFTLRELDAEIAILQATAKSREQALSINKTRVQAGRATAVDVAQAETNYTNVKAELAVARKDRVNTEHALAVLCGVMPTTFSLSERPLDAEAPTIPAGLPTTLLERRPDVAGAERLMAASNAEIGVAQAAFFPTVSLTGQGGYLSASASDLFTWQNSVWAIGPSIRFPVFDGGRNAANLSAARANYDRTIAEYRGTVLRAVEDVENSLADLQFLSEQRTNLDQSVVSAEHATELAHRRFQVGQTNYTEVTVAEEAGLAAQRAQSRSRGQQFYASIRLIKSLGGSWQNDHNTASISPKFLASCASRYQFDGARLMTSSRLTLEPTTRF